MPEDLSYEFVKDMLGNKMSEHSSFYGDEDDDYEDAAPRLNLS